MQERRQVFDIGEAKNVDILERGSSNVFNICKIIYGFVYILDQHLAKTKNKKKTHTKKTQTNKTINQNNT